MRGHSLDVDQYYYELRLYEMVQGRLALFHELMEERALSLFERHDFDRPLAFWDGFAGPISPVYGYLLRWTDLDQRMKAWGGFYSDPEWIQALTINYAGEQRVERVNICFMRALPLWRRFRSDDTQELNGLYEMRRYHGVAGSDEDRLEFLFEDLAQDEARGGRVIGVFEVVIGAPCPQVVAFIAWPSTPGLLRKPGKRRSRKRWLKGVAPH